MIEEKDVVVQPDSEVAESEYDGGRDISKVIEAASKAEAKPVVEAPTTTVDAQKAAARAWKVYKDDSELKDFDPTKMTAAEFLALKFGYNAVGKEQRRDFDGIVRNAQLGHLNAANQYRLEQEREHAVRQWREGTEKIATYESDRKVINQALLAASRNNFEPLRLIVEEFTKALDAEDVEPAAVPEGFVSQADVEADRVGRQVYDEIVWPKSIEIGKQFGFAPEQIAKAIMTLVDRYPAEFFDASVLQHITEVELPTYLTNLREEHPVQPTAQEKKIAELEEKLNKLSAPKIEEENAAVTAAHKRRAAAPPGVPTVAAGAGDDGMPDFKTVAEARKWLKEFKG